MCLCERVVGMMMLLMMMTMTMMVVVIDTLQTLVTDCGKACGVTSLNIIGNCPCWYWKLYY